MMKYKDFYSLLAKNKLITPIWEYVLSLVEEEIKDREDKEIFLMVATIYFSLIDDGNLALSLKKETLKNKWNAKVSGALILMRDSDDFNEEDFNNIKNMSLDIIDNYLDKITIENWPELFGEKHIFDIEDNWLYVKKYNNSRKSIRQSISRLFAYSNNLTPNDDYLNNFKDENFHPSEGQKEIVKQGINKNLIITGGPGTGKTSSVLFILVNLLSDSNKYNDIYMVAPSGKASSRIAESVENNIKLFKDEYRENNKAIFEKISEIENFTIHKLLGPGNANKFRYNRDKQLSDNSIFIIDEASMIDVCMFASLLEAIPDGSRVFILGDKNQLPSVENGAVFADLLKMETLRDNIIELDESIRFSKETDIYSLANEVNENKEITYKRDWEDYTKFEIQPTDSRTCPVYYYQYGDSKERDIIESVIDKWANKFYASLQQESSDLNPEDIEKLDSLFLKTKDAKILTAENESVRGVKYINQYIKKQFIDKKNTNIYGYNLPGQLMMINRNNSFLNLYNGDSGLLVTFKGDNTVYFMIDKKNTRIEKEGKNDNNIFRIGNYTFYPITFIKQDEIDLAYSITIHKSQGSDYNNILVILPNKKGHPLLNRQIIYTAITRTKGNTYILSTKERLEEAKSSFIERDTNIA